MGRKVSTGSNTPVNTGNSGGGSGGLSSVNLSKTVSTTAITINNTGGTGVSLGLADDTHAGLVSPAQVLKIAESGTGAVASVAGKTGVVTLAKADVGLSNVDNTSDANKPISDAEVIALAGKSNTGHTHAISDVTNLQATLDTKQTASQVNTAIQAVVGAAPAALDTLKEIADQLATDENAVGALTSAVAGKAATVHNHAIADVTNLQTTLDGKAVTGHNHDLSTLTDTTNILAGKASTALATTSTPGLLSASDKLAINNMPSAAFLWDAVGARTPFIAHAGDSISYLTASALGNNYILQAIARIYPARIEYGDNTHQCYNGSLSGVVNGDGTSTLTYDGADSEAAFFESHLAVGKWLYFPTSGINSGFNGNQFKILSFNTTAKTITVDSNIQYITASGPPVTFTTKTNITLRITEDTNNYVIAKGGHTSAQIKAGQIPIIQSWTVIPDIMMLNGGTNDGTYTNSAQNIIDVAEAALAAGVKIIAIMPMSPKDAMTAGSPALKQFISSRNILMNYARSRNGCFIIDATSSYLDPASTSFQPIGGSTGVYSAPMADGLHPGVRGGELSAKYLAPLLQAISPKRVPRALSAVDIWDVTDNKAGNILGASGSMVAGTGGTFNAVANTAGTVSGWTYLTYTLDGVGGAVKSPVPSIVTCDYLTTSGYNAQRIDLTGCYAPADGRVFSMTYTRYNGSIFTGNPRMDAEMVMRLNAPNIYNAKFTISVTGTTGQGDTVDLGSTTQNQSCVIAPSTDWLFLPLRRPFKTFTNNVQVQFIITVNAVPNSALSGTVDLAHCGCFCLYTS